MRRLEWLAASCFALVLSAGPWTTSVARLFALRAFEERAVFDMARHLAAKTPASLALGSPYFVGVPAALLLLRLCSPRRADALVAGLAWIGACASLLLAPLLLLPRSDRAAPNPMGSVFAVDLVLMWAWHVLLCLGDGGLRPASLAFGPVFGLCEYIRLEPPRPSSLAGGVAALYASVPALYSAYRACEELGHATLSQTVSPNEWHGYELYAAFSVVFGFVLLCASAPLPRSLGAGAELFLYLLLLNANVAAAWIASRGVRRGEPVWPPRVLGA